MVNALSPSRSITDNAAVATSVSLKEVDRATIYQPIRGSRVVRVRSTLKSGQCGHDTRGERANEPEPEPEESIEKNGP